MHASSFCTVLFSRFLSPVSGQEGLAHVPLGLLNAVLTRRLQRLMQRLVLKYTLECRFKQATLKCAALSGPSRLHLTVSRSRLVERPWDWGERGRGVRVRELS